MHVRVHILMLVESSCPWGSDLLEGGMIVAATSTGSCQKSVLAGKSLRNVPHERTCPELGPSLKL